ncbi:hypothetical protein GMRT_13801 [Giardia muris]|uniref:Uncharacterized protein n=1 Tax=Giardia muris TaxID=5742 RepID=A0A4Z1SZ15_GIAMU|nr:hypothetical protein GMRT_13801 [Giardia muris]|eukprot:TNJ28728.1 hypothetical protein GMRT_13801 [Giardia muris]
MKCNLVPLFDVYKTGVHAYELQINELSILVDCGIAPPYSQYLGVYHDKAKQVDVVLITSGRESHSGALPLLMHCIQRLGRTVQVFVPNTLLVQIRCGALATFFSIVQELANKTPVQDFLRLTEHEINDALDQQSIQKLPDENAGMNRVAIAQQIYGSYFRTGPDQYFWALKADTSSDIVMCLTSCCDLSNDLLETRIGYTSLRHAASQQNEAGRTIRGAFAALVNVAPMERIRRVPVLRNIGVDESKVFSPMTVSYVIGATSGNAGQSTEFLGHLLFVCDGLADMTSSLMLVLASLRLNGIHVLAHGEKAIVDSACNIAILLRPSLRDSYLYTLKATKHEYLRELAEKAFLFTSDPRLALKQAKVMTLVFCPDPYMTYGLARCFLRDFLSREWNRLIITSILPYICESARSFPMTRIFFRYLKQASQATRLTEPLRFQKLNIVEDELQDVDSTAAIESVQGGQLAIPEYQAGPFLRKTSTGLDVDPAIDLNASVRLLLAQLGIPNAAHLEDDQKMYIAFTQQCVSLLVHYLAQRINPVDYYVRNQGRTPIVYVCGKPYHSSLSALLPFDTNCGHAIPPGLHNQWGTAPNTGKASPSYLYTVQLYKGVYSSNQQEEMGADTLYKIGLLLDLVIDRICQTCHVGYDDKRPDTLYIELLDTVDDEPDEAEGSIDAGNDTIIRNAVETSLPYEGQVDSTSLLRKAFQYTVDNEQVFNVSLDARIDGICRELGKTSTISEEVPHELQLAFDLKIEDNPKRAYILETKDEVEIPCACGLSLLLIDGLIGLDEMSYILGTKPQYVKVSGLATLPAGNPAYSLAHLGGTDNSFLLRETSVRVTLPINADIAFYGVDGQFQIAVKHMEVRSPQPGGDHSAYQLQPVIGQCFDTRLDHVVLPRDGSESLPNLLRAQLEAARMDVLNIDEGVITASQAEIRIDGPRLHITAFSSQALVSFLDELTSNAILVL